jgi:hypothetical protein
MISIGMEAIDDVCQMEFFPEDVGVEYSKGQSCTTDGKCE